MQLVGSIGRRIFRKAGVALIFGDRLAREEKKTVGRALFLVGVATTVPIPATVISRRR